MKENRLNPKSNLNPTPSQCKCGKIAQIRGACNSCYAKFMHQVEDGKTTEAALVAKGLLKPGKGLAFNRDNQIFRIGSRSRGKKSTTECLVPACSKPPYRRGLCNTHRVYVHSMLKRNEAHESDLLARGLLLPPNAVAALRKNPKSLPKRRILKVLNKPTGECEIKKCSKPQHAKGLCKAHYSQILRKFRKNPSEDKKKLKEKKPSW